MATDPGSLKIIGGWLTRLSRLASSKDSDKLTTEKLADLAIMLGKEFPSGAFTSDTLQAVASNHPWFPAYADLRADVDRWWGQHKPVFKQIAGPPGAERLSVMDQRWFAFYHKRLGEIEAGHAEDEHGRPRDPYAGRGSAEAARANLADLVRGKAPGAWLVISGHDGRRSEPTDADREAVAQSARLAIQALAEHRTGAPRSASVGDQIAAMRTAVAAGYQPRALTPAELAAARAAQIPGGGSGLAPD